MTTPIRLCLGKSISTEDMTYSETECSVCLDPLETLDKVAQVSCRHVFHQKCVLQRYEGLLRHKVVEGSDGVKCFYCAQEINPQIAPAEDSVISTEIPTFNPFAEGQADEVDDPFAHERGQDLREDVGGQGVQDVAAILRELPIQPHDFEGAFEGANEPVRLFNPNIHKIFRTTLCAGVSIITGSLLTALFVQIPWGTLGALYLGGSVGTAVILIGGIRYAVSYFEPNSVTEKSKVAWDIVEYIALIGLITGAVLIGKQMMPKVYEKFYYFSASLSIPVVSLLYICCLVYDQKNPDDVHQPNRLPA